MHDTTRLLTRHFMRRFVENDLVSPNADRHQGLAAACAALVSPGLFIAVILASKYIIAPMALPGDTALAALVDRLLFVTLSMIVMALVAVAQWDALALDGRDTAILGPLPLPSGLLVRTKLYATMLFAGGAVILLNGLPTLIYPIVTITRLDATAGTLVTLMALHAAITMAAGATGFLAVLAIREGLRAVLGARVFARISTAVQTTLVVGLVLALFLLPPVCARVLRGTEGPPSPGDHSAPGTTRAALLPPIWFVALHERLGGGAVIDLPRSGITGPWLKRDTGSTAIYWQRRARVDEQAPRAAAALVTLLVVSLAAYAWNGRGLPPASLPQPRTRHRMRRLAVTVAGRWLVRHPATQAAFFFTLQTLVRSHVHRLALAVALALGLAAASLAVGGLALASTADTQTVPVPLLAAQAMIVFCMAGGVRYGTRVAADVRAAWVFALAWPGETDRYRAGVRRAALVIVLTPVVLAWPMHALALGVWPALFHLLFGGLLAAALLEIMLASAPTLAFTTSTLPTALTRALPALALPVVLLGTHAFAFAERQAPLTLAIGLVLVLIVFRLVDTWQPRAEVLFESDAPMTTEAQTLGLSD